MSEIKQKRLQILLKLFGEQIKQKIETENLNISEKELFNKFSDYEITESGKYLEWMTKTYIDNGFLYEDLYKVKETLEVFHENKMKLLKDKRDIQQYKTLSELWVEVKKFVEKKDDFLSTNEQKRKEKELAYAETEFLYEDENLRLVAPLTENSSKWWGKGTRWCTAADKNNMFMEYFEDSPLLIFNFKNGEKWQLCMHKINIQFMDENDNNVSIKKIEEKWEYIENIFMKLLTIDSLLLKYFPEKYKTKEICEFSIKKNFNVLRYISKELLTDDLYNMVVRNNGLALKYVPYRLITNELYKIALQNNGLALSIIPNSLRTKELCELAVQQNGEAFWYIPLELRTEELCKLAVEKDGLNLHFVPRIKITKELCEIAVKQNGIALGYVPSELKTKELCELAFQQNNLALFYFHEEYKTKELCEMAVEKDGSVLAIIPYELKTEKICETAIKYNGEFLKYVPEELKTKELCEIAIRQNKKAFEYIPEKLKTKEIYKIFVENKKIFIDNNIEQYKEIFSILNNKIFKN